MKPAPMDAPVSFGFGSSMNNLIKTTFVTSLLISICGGNAVNMWTGGKLTDDVREIGVRKEFGGGNGGEVWIDEKESFCNCEVREPTDVSCTALRF
jgi:hypothetical protein